jgi:flagellar hook protein FlgE
MLRSLYSGISGLRAHQTMLDVTGNNIANVNTTGYKAARTQFEDTLSQVLQAAGAPQGVNGGTNPAQVGLGVQVGAITNDFSNGAAQQTGRALDMMITGDGFFVVNDGGEQLYTRAGAFSLDAVGNLVTANGAKVQGWSAVGGVIDTNGPIGGISLPTTTTMGARATGEVVFKGNLPSDAAPGTKLDRGITVYGPDGTAAEVGLTFTRTAAGWDVAYSIDGAAAGSGTLAFNGNGTLDPAGTTTPPLVAPWGNITVDFADPSGPVTGYAKLDDLVADSQDGQGAGTLQSFSLDPNGTLIGVFSNGFKEPVGQIALSSFANAAGLEKAGDSTYRTTVNSGGPQLGAAGTGARGSLTSGALEMSNVDLSQEFTNLIVAQRGFQAGSRVITTSDELLQELVNLKR